MFGLKPLNDSIAELSLALDFEELVRGAGVAMQGGLVELGYTSGDGRGGIESVGLFRVHCSLLLILMRHLLNNGEEIPRLRLRKAKEDIQEFRQGLGHTWHCSLQGLQGDEQADR